MKYRVFQITHSITIISRMFPLLILSFFVFGCEIEKSEQGLTGSVFVTLSDEQNNAIFGAQIRVNGNVISQTTPAIVSNLPVGQNTIGAFKPGYLDTSMFIDVIFRDTISTALITTLAPVGAIQLTNAPDGSVLLLNNAPNGVTPPTLFSQIGIGHYVVSTFLDGFATSLPARWTINLTAGDTILLNPNFVSVTEGSTINSLAPIFALADDRDSSLFNLSNYRGRVVLVNFFFYQCAPCLAEFPEIQSVYEDPAFSGLIEFFAIDAVDVYPLFARYRNDHPQLGLTFPLLFGTISGVSNDYNVQVNPTNIVIDQTGRIRFRQGSINESTLRGQISSLLAEAP